MRRAAGVIGAVAIAFALAGCGGVPAHSHGDPVGTWGTVADPQPYLYLDADGRLQGSDGCNGLFGQWRQDAPDAPVVFAEFGMSLIMCEGMDTWLSWGRSAIVVGDTLHVLGEDGKRVGTLERTAAE